MFLLCNTPTLVKGMRLTGRYMTVSVVLAVRGVLVGAA
jgi:hypothetical protein